MDKIIIIRRGIKKIFEEGKLKEDFIKYLEENEEDYIIDLQAEKIADDDIQPDGSIDFNVLKVERYDVHFNHERYAETLEKEVYEYISFVDEEEITNISVAKHIGSDAFLDLLTGKLGIIQVDVVFNMTMEEYIEYKPDVNYVEQLISQKVDVEYDLEKYVTENDDVRRDFLLNEIIERGYSAWINPEDLKPEISITLEEAEMALAEMILESGELEKYERVSEFFTGNNFMDFLYRKCLYAESELFSAQVFFEIEPEEYEKEVVNDIESVVILLEGLPCAEYLTEYLVEEMYDELIREDMREKGYPDDVLPVDVGATVKTVFTGSVEQLAERLMSEPSFSLSTISNLSSSNKELLYKNKDLFVIRVSYEIEPEDVIREL